MDLLEESSEERTWEAWRQALHRFVLRRVRDEAQADDIVHQALLAAHARRDSLKDPRRLGPWLYQITRNAIVDHYRASRPHEPLPEDLVEETRDERESAAAELSRCLAPFVQALPMRYREALTLAEIDGLRQREVAARLGLSVSGAKSRIQRARSMLATALLDCCRIEIDRRGGVLDYEIRKGCGACTDRDAESS